MKPVYILLIVVLSVMIGILIGVFWYRSLLSIDIAEYCLDMARAKELAI